MNITGIPFIGEKKKSRKRNVMMMCFLLEKKKIYFLEMGRKKETSTDETQQVIPPNILVENSGKNAFPVFAEPSIHCWNFISFFLLLTFFLN